MIKFFAKGDKNNVVVLGFSHENLKRLKAGKPIAFDLSELHPLLPKVDVFIYAGESEHTLFDDFEQFIGPQTEIKIDPKLKNS